MTSGLCPECITQRSELGYIVALMASAIGRANRCPHAYSRAVAEWAQRCLDQEPADALEVEQPSLLPVEAGRAGMMLQTEGEG